MKFWAIILSLMVANAAYADIDTGTVKLHRFASSHHAWNTNSYFLESPTGIVLIDAQLLKSDASMLAGMIKSTGKPLSGVIVTHPHLDHFGGLPELKAQLGKFPVFAAKGTADEMQKAHSQMLRFSKMPNRFGEALDERFDGTVTIVANKQVLTLAGIDLTIHDLGPGEAVNNIIVYQKDLDLVFAGDTFYPHAHYYIGEGHLDGARNHLNFILENFGAETAVLGGHNNPARAKQASEQIAYINYVEKLTSQAMASKSNLNEKGILTRPARAAVVAEILVRYPNYDDFFYQTGQFLPGNVYGTEIYLKQKASKGE